MQRQSVTETREREHMFRKIIENDVISIAYKGKYAVMTMLPGGGSGIRTRDTVSRIHTFQACAFNRSATPPRQRWQV